MAEEKLPVQVDPLRLAEAGRILRGRYPLRAFARLGEQLVDQDGEVEVELRFGTDEAGIRILAVRLQARLPLQCQRCLEPVEQGVATDTRLGIVRSDAEAERLPPDYDPLLLDEAETLFLQDVVEDELLLALPVVARHEREACVASHLVQPEGESEPAEEEPDERENPFAALADLKTDSNREDP